VIESDESAEEEAGAPPSVLYPSTGVSYPTSHAARHDELNQLNRAALSTMLAWIGDMLGDAKSGEMMARLT